MESTDQTKKSMLFSSLWTKLVKATSASANVTPPNPVELYGTADTSIISEQKVNIIIDRNVRTKYRSGWINKIRSKPVTEVVIHGTAGGETVAGLLHWMYNWGQPRYYEGIGLFHYAIGRGGKGEKDGLIVEVIDPEYYVYHSTSSSNDRTTIGIELLNPSSSNRDPYTRGQYESLFKLIFDFLMPLYPITRITSHRYNIWRWNPQRIAKQYDKNCPGNFDWSLLDKELTARGYSFEVDGDLRFNIQKKKVIEVARSKERDKNKEV